MVGGRRLEAVQSFTDEPLSECPECAGRLRKQFSAVGVVFKGSGFYRTDSRSSATSSESSSTKTETKTETTKTETTRTETKSETKTDSKPATTSSAPAA